MLLGDLSKNDIVVVLLRFLAFNLLLVVISHRHHLLVTGAIKFLLFVHEAATVAIEKFVKDSIELPWHTIL